MRAVHHNDDIDRSVLKRRVMLYHQRVKERHAEAMRVVWWCRQWGVFIKQKHLLDKRERKDLVNDLPKIAEVHNDFKLLLKGFLEVDDQVRKLRSRLGKLARGNQVICRLMQVPGVKVVRATTFYAVIDTPFRFRSKQALWKYMGIGLEHSQSGVGKPRLHVPWRCNRVLKCVILGAAKSAIRGQDNVFAEQHERWLADGSSARICRRNVARSQSAVMWGMWKSGSEFDPRRVAVSIGGEPLTETRHRR